MIARTTAALAGNAQKRKERARKKARADGSLDETGDDVQQDSEEKRSAALVADAIREVEVEDDLAKQGLTSTTAAQDDSVPIDSYEWAVTRWWIWFARKCRRFEEGYFFSSFIMGVILTASVLVGVNTYETDADGEPLLARSGRGPQFTIGNRPNPNQEAAPEDVQAFAKALEDVCIETVESGHMTKDLALLVGGDTPFMTTNEFLAKLDEGLQKKMG